MEISFSPVIHVSDLRKTYLLHEREAGLRPAIKSLFHRPVKEVRAVDGISFDVAPGGIVGFLGPNGAGKTTTLKVLSGLLFPTSGDVTVLGYRPWERQRVFLGQITFVVGQRSQLLWDIPAADSYELQRAIYDIPLRDYHRVLDELTDLLELGPLLRKPVRNLSLGERMKCELAAALLHRPRVLFLDEPTIGLDLVMQRRVRAFIAEYNRRQEATVLLTSHYMADVEALCARVIVIHRGKLLFDGALATLIERFSVYKTITVQLRGDKVDLPTYGEVVARSDGRVTLRVPKAETPRVTERILALHPVTDLTIEDPPLDEVIERLFIGEGI